MSSLADVHARVAVTVSLSPLSFVGAGAHLTGALSPDATEQEAQERFEQELLVTFSDRWEW